MKIYSSNLYHNTAEFGFGKNLIKNKGIAGKASRYGLRKVKKAKAFGSGLKAKLPGLAKSGGRKATRLGLSTIGKGSTMKIKSGFKKAKTFGSKAFGRAKNVFRR